MIRLKLGDWIVGLAVEPSWLAAALEERYADFVCAGGNPDLTVTWRTSPAETMRKAFCKPRCAKRRKTTYLTALISMV